MLAAVSLTGMRKLIFITIVTMVVAACGPVEKQEGIAPFDNAILEGLAKKYCASGQNLVEDPRLVDTHFENLGRRSRVFGFYNGTGRCAMSANVDERWPGPGDRVLTLSVSIARCVPNGSFWEVRSHNTQDKEHTLILRDTEESTSEIRLVGTKDLPGGRVKDATGLRPLACK